MKNFFTRIISILLSLGIIAIIAVIGIIAWKELKGIETPPEVEEFISTISQTVEDIEVPEVITSELSGVEETNNNYQEQQVDYNNVQVDGFLYNQLEEPEQYIYKVFEQNKEQMKTGTAKISFGDFFTTFLNNVNGDTKLLSQYYQAAIEAYTYDNPDVFYLDPNKMYLTVATKSYSDGTKKYEVYTSCGDESSYLIDEFSSREQVNEALAQVEQVKNYLVSHAGNDTYQNIKMVHDYLVDTIEYDESLAAPNIYNIYGALISKVCVCEGYARSFKYVLEAMGIPCIIAVGDGTNSKGETERHAWNYVQYNGRWYAVDVTWDDPVVRGGAKQTQADKTKYFMKGGSEFNKAHVLSNQFTEGGKVFQFPQV